MANPVGCGIYLCFVSVIVYCDIVHCTGVHLFSSMYLTFVSIYNEYLTDAFSYSEHLTFQSFAWSSANLSNTALHEWEALIGSISSDVLEQDPIHTMTIL